MICENCKHDVFEIEQSTGNYFCVNCGLIANDIEEQVSFGKTVTVAQKGISTLLNISDLKIKSTFTINSSERSLKLVSELILQWCFVLVLPATIRDESMYIYSLLLENKMTQGRKIDVLAASCLYVATKLSNPRSLKSIETVTMISAKKILKNSKMITKSLGLVISNTNPYSFVPYIRNKLNLSYQIELKAAEIAKKSTTSNPRVAAGAAVYVAALLNGTPITIDAVAMASQSSIAGITRAIQKETN